MRVAITTRLHNNAFHLTKRVGAPASQAVVEARFAGERECYAGYRDRLVPDENEKDSASCVDD